MPTIFMNTADSAELSSRFNQLTPREREVCLLVVKGLMNKDVAARLGIAIKTIKIHRGRVMKKMGATTVVELVRYVDTCLKAMHDVPEDAAPLPSIEIKPLRVVVVEDDECLRSIMETGLRHFGHDVAGVVDAPGLTLECSRDPVEIVVLDIGLGHGREDGLTIASQLKRDSQCGIIMVTARGEVDQRVEGLQAGADSYFVKPVDLRELSAAISSLGRRVRERRRA